MFGHEALIRGPVETDLHSPIALLNEAHLVGLLPETEFLCREIALTEYALAKNPIKIIY